MCRNSAHGRGKWLELDDTIQQVYLPPMNYDAFMIRPVVAPPPAAVTTQAVGPALGNLAWEIVFKVFEAKWEKESPDSLAVFRLSKLVAASTSVPLAGRQLAVIAGWAAFLSGARAMADSIED